VSNNPLLKRTSNHDLDVIYGKDTRIYNFIKAILGIVNIVSFVGVFYYFIPGFQHVFTQGISWKPTPAFLCIIVFLISVGLTSNKKEVK
jgi:hypothetical protein